LEDLAAKLQSTLTESPPAAIAEGNVIAIGVNAELDELRTLSGQGKDWIAGLQARLRQETGIPSLKVGFNKVFGYYLEVTKAHVDKVPEDFIRKQTLVNCERYFTPELKEQEGKVLGAQEKARLEMELRLFEELRTQVATMPARP
jgi:DNA mismatch repair protein MutS